VSGSKAVGESSPAQIFGNLLRTFRDEAGLSQQEVAERSLCSQPLISGLERGTKATKREQIDFIDHALGAKGKLLAVWPITAAGGTSAERIADLEAEATVIHDWENRVVSGLLQTQDYARAVAHAGFALANTKKIEAIAGKRMERQYIFTKDEPPLTWFVIDECVLYRPYGGRDVMREQLQKVQILAEQPNIVIQVMESSATDHPGGEGPLRIMEYRDSAPIWYTDGWNESGRITENREEVLQAMTSFNLIRACALPPEHSKLFIATVRIQRYE
jgi:transcriptional regulator with XRE-family HTH domain